MRPPFARSVATVGAVLALAGGIFLVYGGPGSAAARGGVLGAALAVAAGLGLLALSRSERPDEPVWLGAAAVAVVAVFLSGVPHRLFFHEPPAVSGAWPWFLLAGFGLARWVARAPARRAPWLLVLAQAALVIAFFDFTAGRIPTRDDHPSFLYRFHLLRHVFPRLVFYNPEWNGGYLATEIVATGSLSPFLLAFPFVWLGPVERLFAGAVPYFFVVLLPWLFFAAMRTAGASREAAALGALVALAPTTVVFLYALLDGLYPFVISCTLAVVASSLFARVFLERDGSPLRIAALVAATTLCILWPLGALMLVPVLAAALVASPCFGRREWIAAAIVGALLVGLNVPWIASLATYGDSARFAAAQRSPIALAGIDWTAAATRIVRIAEEMHPVALAFAPVGLLVGLRGGRRGAATLFFVLFVWNALVAAFGPQVKEQIALERFALPAALFAAACATLAIERMPENGAPGTGTAALGVVLGVILMSTVGAAESYQSRGRYRYRVLPEEIERTLAVLDERCAKERRVLVPGFSLHWFGGGHIAALPLLAGRSFVGNDYYHRRDYNDAVPPRWRDPRRFAEFAGLYDVGCVLTWNEPWAATLARVPEATLAHDEGWLRLWTLGGEGSRFLEGSGRVRESLGRIVVESEDEEVVIKYRYDATLRADPPVPLEPRTVYDGVAFLRIRPQGHPRIEIGY